MTTRAWQVELRRCLEFARRKTDPCDKRPCLDALQNKGEKVSETYRVG